MFSVPELGLAEEHTRHRCQELASHFTKQTDTYALTCCDQQNHNQNRKVGKYHDHR